MSRRTWYRSGTTGTCTPTRIPTAGMAGGATTRGGARGGSGTASIIGRGTVPGTSRQASSAAAPFLGERRLAGGNLDRRAVRLYRPLTESPGDEPGRRMADVGYIEVADARECPPAAHA